MRLSVFSLNLTMIKGDKTGTSGLSYSEDKKEIISNVIIDDAFAEIPFILNPATAALAGFQFFPPFYNNPSAIEDGKWNSDDVTHSVKLIHAAGFYLILVLKSFNN